MEESHWEMGSGFQFGKEQVGYPAQITSLKQKVWECGSTPLFSFPFFPLSPSFVLNFKFLKLLFYFISDKVLTDLIHPLCWTLLQVTSGPEDFWEHSYNWGPSKIILWQVENEAVISPGSAQHKGRGAPSYCIIFPFRSVFTAEEKVSRVVKPSCSTPWLWVSNL